MLRRVMVFVVVAVMITVAVRVGPERPAGSSVASLGAPQALLASPSAGTPEGTPDLGVEVPDEVRLDLLASALVEGLPTGQVSIRLDRVALANGQEFVAAGEAAQVVVVESGEVTATGDGLSGRYGAGVQIVVPAGAVVTVRNEGSGSASLLRLLVQPGSGAGAAATPAGSPIGSPVAGAVPHVLVAGEVSRLAGRRATLVIVRATVPPGT